MWALHNAKRPIREGQVLGPACGRGDDSGGGQENKEKVFFACCVDTGWVL